MTLVRFGPWTAVQQPHVQRIGGAVHRHTSRGSHQHPDRAGDQPHPDHGDALHDPQQGGGEGGADAA